MFDPYEEWLQIPKGNRPPTYFQLLGVSPDERDRAVIEEAALQRTKVVRWYQSGQYAELCVQLLNEISRASETLIDPQLRKAYEQRLAASTRPGLVQQLLAQPIALAVGILVLLMGLIGLLAYMASTPRSPSGPTNVPQTTADAQPAPLPREPAPTEATTAAESPIPPAPKPSPPEPPTPVTTNDPMAEVKQPHQPEKTLEQKQPAQVAARIAPSPKPQPPPGPPVDALEMTAATRQAVDKLFMDYWNDAKGDVVKKARSVVVDSFRSDADMQTVHFCYGVLMLKHGKWDEADRYFKRMTRNGVKSPLSQLGQAYVSVREDRASVVLQHLSKAVEEAPAAPAVVDALAVLNAFWEPTLGGSDARILREMTSTVQAQLSPQLSTRYAKTVKSTTDYMGTRSSRRAELLQQTQTVDQLVASAREKQLSASQDVTKHKADFDSLYQQAQAVKATANQQAITYNQAIAAAQAVDNTSEAFRLTQQKLAAQQRYENQYRQLDLQARQVRDKLTKAQSEYDQRTRQIAKLIEFKDDVVKQIDKALATPPRLFVPQQIRDQVLAGKHPLHLPPADVQLPPEVRDFSVKLPDDFYETTRINNKASRRR